MSDKDIYKMVEILMEISKERYYKFKNDVNEEFAEESVHFLSLLFGLIEKHRPELVMWEGGAQQ